MLKISLWAIPHMTCFFLGVLQRAGTSHCRNPATGGFCLGFGPLNSSKWHSLIIDKAYIKKATESVQKGWRLHPRRGDFSLLKHLALQIVTPQKPLALVLSLVVFFEFHLREMALYPFISGTWLQYKFFCSLYGNGSSIFSISSIFFWIFTSFRIRQSQLYLVLVILVFGKLIPWVLT